MTIMTEEEIVKKLCEIMEVKYSHYDNHKMTKDYFPHTVHESIPKIVVYSGMSPWRFAVLENMAVITPMSDFHKTLMLMTENEFEMIPEQVKLIEDIKEEINRISKAEKFLRDNDCASIINDKNKKINW